VNTKLRTGSGSDRNPCAGSIFRLDWSRAPGRYPSRFCKQFLATKKHKITKRFLQVLLCFHAFYGTTSLGGGESTLPRGDSCSNTQVSGLLHTDAGVHPRVKTERAVLFGSSEADPGLLLSASLIFCRLAGLGLRGVGL